MEKYFNTAGPIKTNLHYYTDSVWYIQPDGSLDIIKLLRSFQDFFRKNSEHWLERYDYKEASPQLGYPSKARQH